jgi:hypothetical protein
MNCRSAKASHGSILLEWVALRCDVMRRDARGFRGCGRAMPTFGPVGRAVRRGVEQRGQFRADVSGVRRTGTPWTPSQDVYPTLPSLWKTGGICPPLRKGGAVEDGGFSVGTRRGPFLPPLVASALHSSSLQSVTPRKNGANFFPESPLPQHRRADEASLVAPRRED